MYLQWGLIVYQIIKSEEDMARPSESNIESGYVKNQNNRRDILYKTMHECE